MIDRISMHRSVSTLIFALGILVIGIGPSARAADSPGATRAARLTYLQGAVTLNQADNTASLPAQVNIPLLAGVQVATGGDGQAEVEFEDGSVVRLTPNSVLSLDNLAIEPGGVFTTNLSLLHGLAYLELRAAQQYRYMLNAGGDVLSPVENTTVRVNLDEAPAVFAVLDGTAHVERQSGNDSASAGFRADVRAGESLRGDLNDPSRYFLTQEIATDSWDQWNEDMDQNAAAQSADTTGVRNDYAGAQGYGWSDLDANGTWYDVPGQGEVWQPAVAADDSGFDPYGNGAWVAYPATGYVWASGYAWGWTPYRCGSWSYFNSFGWGWAPAGCGGFGWGFAGGGYLVNVATYPRGYRPIRVPVPGRGPERPWIPVHTWDATQHPVTSAAVERGPRQIAGVTATPVKPISTGVAAEGAAGSSLRRDYPIDSATKAPVMGLASTRPTAVRPASTLRWSGQTTAPAAAAATATHPYNSGQSHPQPQPAVRPAPATPQVQRPAQQYVPAQRSSAPPAAPRPSYAPAARPPAPPPHAAPAPAPASHPHK